MSDQTPNRVGQFNATGDVLAGFLKIYSGEVLTAFEEVNVVTPDRHIVRTIANGKSASFPATWKATASYHTPGAQILGGTVKNNERIITIDDMLISPVFLANVDEAMNHWDARSIYTREAGLALANQYDANAFRMMILAARAAATVSGGNGGSSINDTDFATNADSIFGTLNAAAQTLDEKDVPSNDRTAYLRPAQYYLLAQSDKLSKFFTNTTANDRALAKVGLVADMEVVKSNHIPIADVVSGPSKYQGSFNTTLGIVSHRTAIGVVKLLDLMTEMETSVMYQGTLIVAKYLLGGGILRPEGAIELRSADPS